MAEGLGESVLKLSTDNSGLDKGLSTGEQSTSASMKRMAKGVGKGMLVMGAAITGLAAVTVKMAVAFDSSMSEVNSLLGLSAAEFTDLKDSTLDMAKALGVDAVESADALYQAISAGVPQENVFEFMEIATKAAIAGVTDTETAVDGLTTVINSFGLDMSETQKVADIMFTAVRLGKTTFEELSASMFQAAPLAAAMGIQFEEVAGAVATLTKSGVPTSVAMTSMRQAMVALQKPTEDMAGLIETLGFESGTALIETKGFQESLRLLADESGASPEQLAKAFGSVEALGAVLQLTGDNAQTAKDDLAEMYKSAGAATEAFDIINASAARQFAILTNRLKVQGIEIGQVLMPVVLDLVGIISDVVDKVMAWTDAHPELTKFIILAVAAIGAFMLVLGPLLLALPGLALAIGFVTGAAAPWLIAIALIAAAVVGIGVLIWHLKNNWEEVWSSIMQFTETAVNFIIRGVNNLTRAWRESFAELLTVVAKVASVFSEDLAASINVVIEALKKDIKEVEFFQETVVTAAKVIIGSGDDMEESFNDVGEAVTDLGTNMEDTFGKMKDDEDDLVDHTRTFAEKTTVMMQMIADMADEDAGQIAGAWDDVARAMRTSSDEQIKASSRALKLITDDQRAQERSIERLNSSWESFETSLIPTIANMERAGLGFGETIELLAADLGISTRQMSDVIKQAGVEFGDTLALMEFMGEERINAMIEDFERLEEAARKAADLLDLRDKAMEEARRSGRPTFRPIIEGGEVTGIITGGGVQAAPGNTIPLFPVAEGGVFDSPSLALLAEAGEAEAVIPLSKLSQMMGGGGDSGTTIIIEGNVIGWDEFERKINNVEIRRGRRGGRR